MGRLWENDQKLERIQEHVAEEHEWQDTETNTCVHGVGNILRLRPAWRSITGALMSTIALLQEDTVGERNVCGKCRFGTKIYNRHVNHVKEKHGGAECYCENCEDWTRNNGYLGPHKQVGHWVEMEIEICTVELNGKAVGRYEGMKMKTKMQIKWNSGKTKMKMKIKMKIDMNKLGLSCAKLSSCWILRLDWA